MRMVRLMTMLSAAAGLVSAAPPKPALLVLGVPHFGNPGLDMSNVRVEDVLAPARQREIAVLVDRLARFHPTHVAVEWPVSGQARLDKRYADYRAGRYELSRDEVDQIGLRLAARAGLARVDAVDWNEEPPGTDKDYDFEAWAKAHGRDGELKAMQADTQSRLDAFAARNRCRPVADWLREMNGPAFLAGLDAPYYRIATFGDAAFNPGAAWVGGWHARNLRILANLERVAGRPNDRVIAVFGAGHASLLKSYAAGSDRFTVADTLAALPAPSARRGCAGG